MGDEPTGDPFDDELNGQPVLVVSVVSVDPDGQGAGSVVVRVEGELDLHGARELRRGVDDALAVGGNAVVEIDLRDVTFIDSSGLQAVLGGRDAVDAAGRGFRITGMSAFVERVVSIAGLTGAFS